VWKSWANKKSYELLAVSYELYDEETLKEIMSHSSKLRTHSFSSQNFDSLQQPISTTGQIALV
jgi:hypothetical protein